MYHNMYDYEDLFQTPFRLDKKSRIEFKQSEFTHCMVLSGVECVNGKPAKWKVENSWGTDYGKKGYFIMSDDWFTEHTCDLLVPKKFLSEKHLEMFKQKPILLPPWYSM